MKISNGKTLLRASIIAACGGFAGFASAAPFQIDFEQNSAFLFDTDVPTPTTGEFGVNGTVNNRVTGVESIWWPSPARGTVSDNTPIDTDTNGLLDPIATDLLVGGESQNPVSALKVVALDGTLIVPENGDWSNLGDLSFTYHRNNQIPGTSTTPIFGAIADSTLFELIDGDGVTVLDSDLDENILPFFFNETENSGNCQPEGNPNGTICDDLFEIPLISFAPVDVMLGGLTFQFEFNIVPGDGVTTNLQACRDDVTACDVRDVPGFGEVPFFTVWTGENDVNFLSTTVRARLVPEQVPAPGALSLVGLGLAGLGAALRRRRKAAS
jgi:hypothetical protein